MHSIDDSWVSPKLQKQHHDILINGRKLGPLLIRPQKILTDIKRSLHSQDDKPDSKNLIVFAWLQDQRGLYLYLTLMCLNRDALVYSNCLSWDTNKTTTLKKC